MYSGSHHHCLDNSWRNAPPTDCVSLCVRRITEARFFRKTIAIEILCLCPRKHTLAQPLIVLCLPNYTKICEHYFQMITAFSFSEWICRLFKRSPLPPRVFPQDGFTVLDSAVPLEEESQAFYNPDQWFPARIGDVYHSYQIISKLGYGGYSTVWLCRNLTYVRHTRTEQNLTSS